LTEWVDAPDGPTRLCYPQARHWVHRRQWDHAWAPSAKDRASYLKNDFAMLAEAEGVLQLVDGDNPAPPFEGVEWFVSHGHTPGQLHPVFGTRAERLLFLGDLAPTRAHLRPPWVMAYDLRPLVTIRERETVYRRCLDEGMLLAFPHDPAVGGVAVAGTVDCPVVSRELPL
ncbi:MAG: MBL fold metallo-hydrolase, partial [Planctomycetes bacterium]|nr:MBL fold metallo-hydrolase [Planctomycetota bacterium]